MVRVFLRSVQVSGAHYLVLCVLRMQVSVRYASDILGIYSFHPGNYVAMFDTYSRPQQMTSIL